MNPVSINKTTGKVKPLSLFKIRRLIEAHRTEKRLRSPYFVLESTIEPHRKELDRMHRLNKISIQLDRIPHPELKNIKFTSFYKTFDTFQELNTYVRKYVQKRNTCLTFIKADDNHFKSVSNYKMYNFSPFELSAKLRLFLKKTNQMLDSDGQRMEEKIVEPIIENKPAT